MMRYTFSTIVFSILLFSTTLYAQPDAIERDCTKQKNLAQKDYYNKEMKYYSFGLMSREGMEREVLKAELLKDYHIEYINRGCVIEENLVCYNQGVDLILQRTYGKNFLEQIEVKVDSMQKIQAAKTPRKQEIRVVK